MNQFLDVCKNSKARFFPPAISSSCPIYLLGFLLHTGTAYTQTLTEVGECIFKKFKKK